MNFSISHLETLARRESLPNASEEWFPSINHLRPGIEKLRSQSIWEVRIVQDGEGGLSNYVELLVHRALTKSELSSARHHKPHEGVGVSVYFSLLTPIAVIGRTRFVLSSHLNGCIPLDLDSLLPIVGSTVEEVKILLEAFADSGYQFASPAEVEMRLPNHIKPYEYCLSKEPWDRVFHVLFANTD